MKLMSLPFSFLAKKERQPLLIFLLVVLVLVEVIWAAVYLRRFLFPTSKFSFPSAKVSGPSLILFPSEGSFKVGDDFSVNVELKGEGCGCVTGADVILSFDPEILEAFEVQPGNLYTEYPLKEIDNELGKIRFSALNPLDELELSRREGAVGVIIFRAKEKGKAKVEFDFTPGSTTDTNVAAGGGGDILAKVVDGEYIIE